MAAKLCDSLDDAVIVRLAHQALAVYPWLTPQQVDLFCRSENATLRVIDQCNQCYALRLHRPDYHSLADIRSELCWLQALQAAGIPVPQAMLPQGNQPVVTVRIADGLPRYAVLFDWIEGDVLQSDVNSVCHADFVVPGEITARLHQQSRQWVLPTGFSRLTWDHDSMVGVQKHWGDWREVLGLRPDDCALIENCLRRTANALHCYGKSPARFGLIHADLRLTNIMRCQDDTRVIDFDDCGFGGYLHDMAAAINFVEHHPAAPEWVAGWLDAYQHHCPLGVEDRAVLSALFMQRCIQLLAWVGSHADTEQVRSLGPRWVDETLRLCRRYQNSAGLPLGAD
ncbi:MAG: phosphotransferase enzyme family protein [Sodalis sp. (in: enterobacteria)]|uniref:phosphotransferase enzyme family protein n=1 Tax=Sodalis sp. (in: enterobacteria) TaxID=1898979 RepID=UPI003F3A139B